jgi:pimeloyl-ACP methyl ester carboxylesterase
MLIFLLLSSAYAACDESNEHILLTEDKSFVCLHHYPAEGPAILMVHGIASNSNFWDVSPTLSVAKYFQDKGYDVWTLDERGHGEAQQSPTGKRLKGAWAVDDYGYYDIDAAIKFIMEKGHTAVHYFGHSLGGIVLAPYIERHGDASLSSVVILSSPMDFQNPDGRMKLSGVFMALSPRRFNIQRYAKWAAVFKKSPFKIDDLLFSPDSMSVVQRRTMYKTVVSPLNRQELLQLRKGMKDGEIKTLDGAPYPELLNSLESPTLVIAGQGDQIAPSERVKAYYSSIGSTDKVWMNAGVESGYSLDYGHLDILISDTAFQEIIPILHQWVENHPSDTQNAFPTDL